MSDSKTAWITVKSSYGEYILNVSSDDQHRTSDIWVCSSALSVSSSLTSKLLLDAALKHTAYHLYLSGGFVQFRRSAVTVPYRKYSTTIRRILRQVRSILPASKNGRIGAVRHNPSPFCSRFPCGWLSFGGKERSSEARSVLYSTGSKLKFIVMKSPSLGGIILGTSPTASIIARIMLESLNWCNHLNWCNNHDHHQIDLQRSPTFLGAPDVPLCWTEQRSYMLGWFAVN
jgi:hypothetical protein